jgi:hypothetical protein
MGKSINSQTKKLLTHFKNYFGLSKTATYRNTYIGCECESHEIRLVDSDDSMTGIKLVDLHEFTQGFGL